MDELRKLKAIDKYSKKSQISFARLSLALIFVAAVSVWSYVSHSGISDNIFLVVGAVFGAYMAMNIGANDVANNVGPAVGSKAITLFWAIVIAVIFEASGAIIAGGDVVSTVKSGIINPDLIDDPQRFIWAMTAALLSAALWLNFATSVGAPVSTTHSIVGGVMGGGIAAVGFHIVDWESMGMIVSSWVISPLLGGIIAATFLYYIKKSIIFTDDMIKNAKRIVPILISFMILAFTTYIILKGFKKLIHLDFISALSIGFVLALISYFILKSSIAKKSATLQNNRRGVNSLFTLPLIFSAALLSFAHGANDVANAIGPLAAINDAVLCGEISQKAEIPFWIMAVGAFGLAIGLALYGPRLIKTVGSEITELDQIRAFCIAMAAALTVIIASQLGLPVSSTHIAIGGVFGVGLLREYLDGSESKYVERTKEIFKANKKIYENAQRKLASLEMQESKTKDDYESIVELYKTIEELQEQLKEEKIDFKNAKKIQYVKRDAIKKIVAAWIITVPAAAMISAGIFFMIKGIVLP